MQALILAGGLGTRLRSVVNDRPKPLAPVAEKPFLEYQVDFLRGHGFLHLIFCVGYRHEQIRSHFGDGARWGVRIDYCVEEEPRGTAGALKGAERLLYGPFLALNGDSFFEVDLSTLRRFHTQKKAAAKPGQCLATLALARVADGRDYGAVELDPQRRIVAFAEKTSADNGCRWVNAGVYVLERNLLGLIPAGRKVSLEKEMFPTLAGKQDHLFGYHGDGTLIDIGTPEGYRRFHHFVKEREL